MHISDLHYCHCIQGCFYEYENLVVTGNTYLGQLDLPNATKDCCFWIENVAVDRHLENNHAGCSKPLCCSKVGSQSKLIVITTCTMTLIVYKLIVATVTTSLFILLNLICDWI